jgi:glycosyltransferase involved in cell wall biosynthesis
MKVTNKNIYWIVTELFYPDEVSTAQILTDVALKKVDEGRVKVITGPSGYEKSYSRQNKELDSRVEICRIRLPHFNKNNFFQRILKMQLLTLKMSWIILVKVKKDDTLLLVTNPTFLIVPLSIIKKIKKFNFQILVHDVFPENLVAAGLVKKNSFKYELLSKIYNKSYGEVDRVIVLGEDMKTLLKQKTSPKDIRIDIIPNWFDNDIRPLNDFNISGYLGIDVSNKIVIGFAGNLGRLQGVLEFIDLFNSSNNPETALIIIGDGALKSSLIHKIKIENLNNVFYLGPKGRNEQNLFLNACHIGLVTLISGMRGLGVPSKTYNLMAAGKPILYLGDKNSEIDSYVKKFDCGWSFSWENEAEILLLLKKLSSKNLSVIFEKGLKSRIASENFKKDNLLNLF